MNAERTFPLRGLTYFWFLNDRLEIEELRRQIQRFADSNVSAICLHPRDGLLTPYGSEDWFRLIREVVETLAENGIEAWLYDEDPYPSGNAGGRIILDHPEFIARKISMHQPADEDLQNGLWCFPARGTLLWCGLVSKENGEITADLSRNVGMVRREWEHLGHWDSRFYYPATPLYHNDRALSSTPEYAMQLSEVPADSIVTAFTVEPIETSRWGFYVDSLNPQATQKFIEYTHDLYYSHLGHMFGKEITAIFTDEPKYHDSIPWTVDLFEAFNRRFGYELRGRLYDLFSSHDTSEAIRTRLNFREWCGERFENGWVKPISEWCRKHNLYFVGHISPEDDPVTQACCLSNLMPLQKHFSLAGLDLIIPAVGDADHPLINIGVISAVSSAQQHHLPGVMSESLAASGRDFTGEGVRRILNWQTVMGMTTPVIHGIYYSLREERAVECPPDFGPDSPHWDALQQVSRELRLIQDMLVDATQIAPVGILWPIKSFHNLNRFWQEEPGGLRGEFLGLVLECLEKQIGIELIDETDLHGAEFADMTLKIGKAEFSHIIIPGSTVWDEKSLKSLKKCQVKGIKVYRHGTAPSWQETPNKVERHSPERIPELDINVLPRLIQVSSKDNRNIRVSKWRKENQTSVLLCYLGERPLEAQINGRSCTLSSQTITCMDIDDSA